MEVAGYGGSITCTNLTAGVKSWKIDLKADALETTDYSDAGIRHYDVVGLKGWSGSCEVNWDATNIGLVIGAIITTLVFTVVAGKTYSGATAIVTGIGVGSIVDGLVSMSVSFQGSGILTPPA